MVSASSTAASTAASSADRPHAAAAARATATASAAELPRPARDGTSAAASKSSAGASSRRTIADSARPTGLSSAAIASSCQAGTRRRPLPGRAVAVMPTDSPAARAGCPYTTACSPIRMTFACPRPVGAEDEDGDEDEDEDEDGYMESEPPLLRPLREPLRELAGDHARRGRQIARARDAAQKRRRADAVDDLRQKSLAARAPALADRAQRRLRQSAQSRAQRQCARDVEPAPDPARCDHVDARAGNRVGSEPRDRRRRRNSPVPQL